MVSSDQQVKDKTQSQLLDAITREHFVLYGQPIVALSPGRDHCAYVEVLIRYLEEERNALPPGGFIDVLEELKLMGLLDRWVVNRVMGSLVKERAAKGGGELACYSVNLSADSLGEHEFPKLVREYLRKSSIPPGKLRFEVSESDAEANVDALRKLTAEIVPAGCGVTISSYNGKLLRPATLPRLGVDSVKISSEGLCDDDLNYTWSGVNNPQAVQLACAALRIRTIAEMVESSATLEAVRQLGFDYAQGFAVAEPAPLQALVGTVKQ